MLFHPPSPSLLYSVYTYLLVSTARSSPGSQLASVSGYVLTGAVERAAPQHSRHCRRDAGEEEGGGQWDTQQTEGSRCRALGPHPSPFINPSKRKLPNSKKVSKYVWGQSEQQEQGDEAVEQETGHGSPEHTGLLGWITRPLPVWWPWGGMVVVICSLPGGKAEVVTNTVYRASFGTEQTHI